MSIRVLVSFINPAMANKQLMHHIRVLAPSSPLKILSMRPTTLTLNPEIRMQARQRMRNIALIGTSLLNRNTGRENLPAERVEMSPILSPQCPRRHVVLIGVPACRRISLTSAKGAAVVGSLYLDGVMFNLAPVATAPAVRHWMTLTLCASRRAFVAERTMNCPEA